MDEEKDLQAFEASFGDFAENDSVEAVAFETASPLRRFLAYLVDLLLMIAIWYLATRHLFREIDEFVEKLGLSESDFTNLELFLQFRDMLWQLYLKVFLYWIFIKTAYFMLIPAFIGNGQSVGKLLAGIAAVDRRNLGEMSASRLVLREFIGRGLLETLLILPYLVSLAFVILRKDGRSLHDLVSRTVVIKLDLNR